MLSPLRPSVCPSVCHTVEVSPQSSPIPVVVTFCGISLIQKFWRVSLSGLSNNGGVGKTSYFFALCVDVDVDILKTVRDTSYDQSYTMTNTKLHNYARSIDSKVDDLGWPWSAISSNFLGILCYCRARCLLFTVWLWRMRVTEEWYNELCPHGCMFVAASLNHFWFWYTRAVALDALARLSCLKRSPQQEQEQDERYEISSCSKMTCRLEFYCISRFSTMSTRSSATAERQRVSYTRLSRLTHWSYTSLNTAFTVVQLYNRLAKLVSTLSANKSLRTLSWIGHSRSFQVILVGAGRNPDRCVVIICN